MKQPILTRYLGWFVSSAVQPSKPRGRIIIRLFIVNWVWTFLLWSFSKSFFVLFFVSPIPFNTIPLVLKILVPQYRLDREWERFGSLLALIRLCSSLHALETARDHADVTWQQIGVLPVLVDSIMSKYTEHEQLALLYWSQLFLARIPEHRATVA